jgi:hypothetical protein
MNIVSWLSKKQVNLILIQAGSAMCGGRFAEGDGFYFSPC